MSPSVEGNGGKDLGEGRENRRGPGANICPLAGEKLTEQHQTLDWGESLNLDA